MAGCSAIKPNGERCKALAAAGKQWCAFHDPARKEARRRAASKGGRGKASRELPAVKARLEELTEGVLAGELETARAAVANQLVNTRLRAIELERKIKEADELEERIRRLEEDTAGGARWRA
jgi:hypothetical protein